jgi:hypothetical protein
VKWWGVNVGESGSEWGRKFLRIFEKDWVRDPSPHTPLIVFNAIHSPPRVFLGPREV